MNEENKKYWFRAKRYGWGWGFPCSWQGWVVFLAYIIDIAIFSAVLIYTQNQLIFIVGIALSSAALIAICYMTGEKPSWRWGDKK